MRKYPNLAILAGFLILVAALTACGGSSLSKQQAIDTFVQTNGDAEQVTVNSMVKCDLDDQAKVAYNIDNAWLVNMDFYSPMLKQDQNIAVAIGEKDGKYKIVAQGTCPW